MCSGSLPGDFGGCLLVWKQFMFVWGGDSWNVQDTKLVIYDVCLEVLDEVTVSMTSGPSANDGKVAWVASDAGNDDQVFLWQAGSVTQITTDEVDHEWPEVGDDLIVYRKYLAGPDAMAYWDLNTDEEVLIMLTDTPDERWRMDGNLLALRLYGPPRLYYAFLNEADVSVTTEGTTFSNEQPYEGEQIDVTVAVSNIAPVGTTDDITVCLYDGDPDADNDGEVDPDAILLGCEVIPGMPSQSQVVVKSPAIVIDSAGSHDIYARVSVPSGDNPANNMAFKTLEVLAPGACCLLDGTCIDGLKAQQCAAAAGNYHGDGSDCVDVQCPECPWDLNGDASVGILDLLALLANWGPCV